MFDAALGAHWRPRALPPASDRARPLYGRRIPPGRTFRVAMDRQGNVLAGGATTADSPRSLNIVGAVHAAGINAIHATARLIDRIAEARAFEVDLRSDDPGALDRIEADLFEAAGPTGHSPALTYGSADSKIPISLGFPAANYGRRRAQQQRALAPGVVRACRGVEGSADRPPHHPESR